MAYALSKYYTTKNHNVNGTMSVWGKSTTLWPTFLLLAVALITLLLNLITICAYFRGGVEKANSTSNAASYIGYVLLAVHVIVWAVSMGLFKMANSGKDLWGYSCGSQADAIQEEVKSFIDFGKLCTTQVRSYVLRLFCPCLGVNLMLLTYHVTDWSILHHDRPGGGLCPHPCHLHIQHATHDGQEEAPEDE